MPQSRESLRLVRQSGAQQRPPAPFRSVPSEALRTSMSGTACGRIARSLSQHFRRQLDVYVKSHAVDSSGGNWIKFGDESYCCNPNGNDLHEFDILVDVDGSIRITYGSDEMKSRGRPLPEFARTEKYYLCSRISTPLTGSPYGYVVYGGAVRLYSRDPSGREVVFHPYNQQFPRWAQCLSVKLASGWSIVLLRWSLLQLRQPHLHSTGVRFVI